MLILAARVYHDCEDVCAPDAFVLELSKEVTDALKSDIEYLQLCDTTRRFASISFDTPGGVWVEDEDLRELLQDNEAVVLYWNGIVPEDIEPMERQCHTLRFHKTLYDEISFHARGSNTGFHFSTEPISCNWLFDEIEKVVNAPIDNHINLLLEELGF